MAKFRYEVGISNFDDFSTSIEHPINEGSAIRLLRDKKKLADTLCKYQVMKTRTNNCPELALYAYVHIPEAYLSRTSMVKNDDGEKYRQIEFYDLEAEAWGIQKKMHGFAQKPPKKKKQKT